MGTKSVAIDIGATVVRVAEVELGGGADPRDGATLHAYAERPIAAGIIRDGSVEEPGALAAVIKQALTAAKPTSKNITLGVGHPSVVVREVDIPAQPMDKVRESLAFHVQDQLPMAPDEALLDFYPTSEYDAQAGPTLRGLLVAAPRDVIRDLVSILDQAGVTPAAIDHSALALWRASCRGPLMERNVALVDVGASTTLVTASQAGAPRLVRALPQASGDANRAISAALKGQSADPEQLKREIGMDPSAAGNARIIADAVGHALTPLIEAIRNTIVYVSSSNPGAGVERIVLSGGGAYVRGFGQALSSATRLPVVISEPLNGMKFGKKVDQQSIKGQEAALATVIGLAHGRPQVNPLAVKYGAAPLASVNLVPKDIQERRKLRAVQFTAMVAVLIAIGAVILGFLAALGAQAAAQSGLDDALVRQSDAVSARDAKAPVYDSYVAREEQEYALTQAGYGEIDLSQYLVALANTAADGKTSLVSLDVHGPSALGFGGPPTDTLFGTSVGSFEFTARSTSAAEASKFLERLEAVAG